MKRTLIFGCALSLSVLMAGPPAQAAEPPGPNDSPSLPALSSVDDVLSGRRTLFRVDDLMAGYTNKNHTFHYGRLETKNGGVSAIARLYKCFTKNNETTGPDFAIGIGHFFNYPENISVLISQGHVSTIRRDGSECGVLTSLTNPLGAAPAGGQMVKGDFNGDTYIDLAIIANGRLYAVTATNLDNPDNGVTFGPPADDPIPEMHALAFAAADFDGDGADELAVITVSPDKATMQITVYDARGATPAQLQFTPIGSTSLSSPGNGIEQVNAVAGPFNGTVSPVTGRQEVGLLIAYGRNENKPVDHGSITLASLTATLTTAKGQPPLVSLVQADQVKNPDGIGPNITGLQSGYLDFFSPTVQAVLSTYDVGSDNSNHISVITLDPDSRIDVADTISYGGEHMDSTIPVTQAGIALGNFGQVSDPEHPLTLQIASLDVFRYTCENPDGVPADNHCDTGESPYLSPRLRFFQVDPANNYKLSGHTNNSSVAIVELEKLKDDIQDPTHDNRRFPWLSISSGDLQGRSLLLGVPTKIATSHVQPSMVIGMPPSHVDWVAPADSTQPEVLNLSAIKGGYYASITSANASDATSTNTSKTSWTNAVQASTSAGYQWGVAGGSLSASVTASAGYMHEHSVSDYLANSTGVSSSVSVETGSDDSVWTLTENQNIYIYPVIGQTACPAEKPACSNSEKLPLTVMFYGPDTTQRKRMDGSTLEWYQPVWQPNNIFSYPSTANQAGMLAAEFLSGTPVLMTNPTPFATDSSSTNQKTEWTNDSGSGTTIANNTNITWGTSFSASLKPPKVVGGPSGSFSISYNGSKAISSLDTETSKVSSSHGIGVTTQGTFANSNLYNYSVTPMVYGRQQAAAGGTGGQGPLFATYSVSQSSGGSWWKRAYLKPDIALNHPAQWTISTSPGPTDRSNCLSVNSASPSYSCASFTSMDTSDANLWNSEALWMKGLLISPGDGALEGPQLMQAKENESVRLSARVYNLSSVDMAPGSNVIVQFYAQAMNNDYTPAGDADLLQNVTLDAIPGFNSQAHPDTTNWALATTVPIPMKPYADKYLVFWVLVVGKDATGMVAEMPSHGLTAIPPTLARLSDASHWIEPHSNNLGYYHSMFYVAPASPGGAQPPRGDTDRVPEVETFTVNPERPALHEKAMVQATLHIDGTSLDGLAVGLYDGDPSAGGRLFEQELIAHVRDGDDYQVRVPYRAKTCGRHTLYLDINAQTSPVTATVDVPGDPSATVQELLDSTFALQMRAGDRQHLVNRLLDIEQSLGAGQNIDASLTAVEHYRQDVDSMRGNMIPVAQADEMLDKSDLLTTCVLATSP